MNVALDVRDSVVTKLRKQYPWMKTQAIDDMAAECYEVLAKGIEEQVPVMRESKSKFSFLSLSGELRNRIYELVLIKRIGGGKRSTIDIVSEREVETTMGYPRNNPGMTLWARQPWLTRVSHQIRNETLPIYYGDNVFEVRPGGWPFSKLLELLESGSANYSHQDLVDALSKMGGLPEVSNWLQAIGGRNVALIRQFDIRVEDANSACWAVALSRIQPYVGGISTAFATLFGGWSVDLPAGTCISAQKMPDYEWKRLPLTLGPLNAGASDVAEDVV